jgi:arginyl-tRNA--protein-N-Asp/Glu arginylyltransferase
MYHRLNGKLVAVGVLDFLYQNVNSGYFIYDPEFKFLNLGQIGAFRELEFIKKQRLYTRRYRWYVLGDMVPVCPKVNYKL